MSELFDVAIIGGGPAGSAAGTLLARSGRKVAILEKEKFPRFRVGESMVPASNITLARMGVIDKLERGDFLVKYGGEISSACGGARNEFLFRNGLKTHWKTAFQVERSRFDQVLLEHAAESGCTVREEVCVEQIDFRRDGVQLFGSNHGTVDARYVIDCSGRNSLIAHRLNLKEPLPHLKKISLFAYFTGVDVDQGERATLTRMIRAKDSWFWLIPMTRDRCSVGVVMDTEKLREMNRTPKSAFEFCLSQHPEIAERMKKATAYTPVRVTSDFSYRVKELTGERWLLSGDAAGFIDPVFSSGIYLALYAGERAADAVEAALRFPKRAPAALRKYANDLQNRFNAYLKLSSAWYTQEFMEIFLHPREMLKIVPTVNFVLGGNPARNLPVRLRMCLFFFLVYLQGKTGKLVPHLTFSPSLNNAESESRRIA